MTSLSLLPPTVLSFLLLTCIFCGLPFYAAGVTVRITMVCMVPLQPSGGQCVNQTYGMCVAGFPQASYYVRRSREQYPNQIVLDYIDDMSKFPQFHPQGLAVNAMAWERRNSSAWAFYEPQILTMADTPRVRALFQATSIPPLISHANVNMDSGLFSVVRREFVVTIDGVRVALLVLTDWTRLTYPCFNPYTFLPGVIKHIRFFYSVDVVVVMYSRLPVPTPWQQLCELDIDFLITWVDYFVYPRPPTVVLNGTTVIFMSNVTAGVRYIDMDIDGWRNGSLSGPQYTNMIEYDLATAMNTSFMLTDPEYLADGKWMQEQVDAANRNNPVVGECDHFVFHGTAANFSNFSWAFCRHTECELGNWWSKTIFDYVKTFAEPLLDVSFFVSGVLRNGFPKGNVSLSDIWASDPFSANLCVFSIYGIDLYDIMNYSFSRGTQTWVLMVNNGPFSHYYGARFVHNPALPFSRIISVEIMQNGTWEPLQRSKIYRVATTSFECGGGYNYGFIKPVPGTTKRGVDIEVHSAAMEVINRNGFQCPHFEGRMIESNSTDALIMKHMTQADCPPNTRWVASALDCLACPDGQYNEGFGNLECRTRLYEIIRQITGGESDTLMKVAVPIIVSVGGFLLLASILSVSLWTWRRKRLARQLLRSAPTGEVTIVFTDIQGSTALWDRQPQAMVQALEIHNEVIRREIRAWGGYEVKTIGDSFMVAFDSAVSAVNFGVRVQRQLLHEHWPEKILAHEHCTEKMDAQGNLIWNGLRVRIGMEMGQPDPVVDHQSQRVDYFGHCVNMAARVESKAHGGEICVTKKIADILTDESTPGVPQDIVVKQLGSFRLKGISQKTVVFAVMPTELSAREFPAAKPLACDRCAEKMQCPRCDAEFGDLVRPFTPRTARTATSSVGTGSSTFLLNESEEAASRRGSLVQNWMDTSPSQTQFFHPSSRGSGGTKVGVDGHQPLGIGPR